MLRKGSQAAFTIVELLIVVVVIAILATISIVAYQGISGRAQTSALKSDLANGSRALSAALALEGEYPSDLGGIPSAFALRPSGGNSYSYTREAGGTSYCLEVSGYGQTYSITGANPSPTEGDCSGSGGGGAVAVCSSFTVGDTGPAGGKIFYKDTSTTPSTCYEAAPAGWFAATAPSDPQAEWGCYGSPAVSGASGHAIGNGKQNSQALIAAGCTTPRTSGNLVAVSIASSYTGGGKSDWYLPSLEEVKAVSVAGASIGGMSNGSYWSSTQGSITSHGWRASFPSSSGSGSSIKSNLVYVRPIRSF